MVQDCVQFGGERCDPVSGIYPLGNGYRLYNPDIMRFTCPDSLSPFGAGGVNSYAYCNGDPLNREDPSGHMSWQSFAGVMGGIIGIALTPLTLGQSLTVASCIVVALDIVSGATAILSGTLEHTHPTASAALGWIAFATGLLTVGSVLASRSIAAICRTRLPGNAMVMDLDSEFSFVATFGRTSRRGANQETMMSVLFDDSFVDGARQSHRRLNIWAHGRRPNRLFIGGRAMTAPELVEMLDAAEIELADYDLVRFISCHSDVLAQDFTRETLMTATGFRGRVVVQGHTVAALREMSAEVMGNSDLVARTLFEHSIATYPARTTAAGVNIFGNNAFFRIQTGRPVSYRMRPDELNMVEQMRGDPLPDWVAFS